MSSDAPIMAPEPLVLLEGVGKDYPATQQAAGKLVRVWEHLRGVKAARQQVFRALDGVGLTIKPGQSTGLIGVNGAGKSTLMKLVAGVMKPDRGVVQVNGRVSALLELGAGFHPEYTGRANIDLACALMGLTPEQTADRLQAILAFADIGTHIEQPVKHYSSGMVVRLGFAVATCVTPDLLITDEVLAVGDESFQRKCISWLEGFLAQGGTLLLCSHSMYHIQKLCTHAAWIDGGCLRQYGEAGDVTRSYLAWHEKKAAPPRTAPVADDPMGAGPGQCDSIYQIRTMALNGQAVNGPLLLRQGSALTVSGTVYSPDDRPPGVAVGLVRANGTPVYGTYSDQEGYVPTRQAPHLWAYSITFPDLALLPGQYVARSHALDPEGMRLFDCVEQQFEVLGSTREEGFCRLPHTWQQSQT